MNLLIPLAVTIFIEFIVFLIAIRKKVGMLFFSSLLINAFTIH